MARESHFGPELFEFLTELKDNNDREWFKANRDRFRRDVQEPMLRFIADFSAPLAEISPHFLADPRPSGGSMFRIYRDTRFAKDKSPYKTHVAAQFRHRMGRDVHAPGFYVHVEPGSVFVGAGIWHPDGKTLAAIRDTICDDPDGWRAAVSDPGFTARHTLGGDSLKRAPRGYDPEHPLIDDLKRKDFVSFTELDVKQACSGEFLDEVATIFAAATPFVRFLTHAVGQEF